MRQASHKIRRIIFIVLTLLSINGHADFDIRLKSTDDSLHRLSEYIGHGKWVVLNFWGTRCPPCREEIPELVRFHDEHQDSDSIVVGIAIDFPSFGYAIKDEVTAFADDYFIDFPVLLSDAGITERIGLGRLQALPTTYVFAPGGEIAGMQVGGITKKILEDFINRSELQSPGSKNPSGEPSK
ncbi:MAG: TlpA family protein disulfide reductase [Gammaproteobacteria bacterium]|jgi:thiol-disulfide isomerase/thioredoxin|nr:TlpA family protein disulfide reductase [Gammaproteobacteria bacterium]